MDVYGPCIQHFESNIGPCSVLTFGKNLEMGRLDYPGRMVGVFRISTNSSMKITPSPQTGDPAMFIQLVWF